MALSFKVLSAGEKIDKQMRIYALAGRGVKLMTVEVTFGASDNYATNGVAADLKRNGLKELIEVIPTFNDAGVKVEYDTTNEKIKMYGQEPTDTTTGVVALKELANGSAIPNNKKFRFLVFGR